MILPDTQTLRRAYSVSVPHAQPSERELAAQFERLYAAFETPILNYLYRLLGDPRLAEDLTQETFTRAWHARRDLPKLDNPRAWTYRIATNLARDHMRRARLLRWLPLLGNEPALTSAEHDADPIASETMRRALLKLADDYRAPLVLYTCHEFSVAEIAATLNLSTDAVKQRLVRARQQLRNVYEGAER
jgi:RNA polymerase sigma-70 factor (ECF subfamily)